MNWKWTKRALIKISSDLQPLPDEWRWRIDLRGADLRRADLNGAYLNGAYLNGAYLSGADLSGADLSEADLSEADLSRADLRGADLRRADLSRADLRGADLRRADLSRADLRGAKLAWTSHNLLAEILRREAHGDVDKLKIAGLVLIQRQWCWREFLALDDPLRDWALKTLAGYRVEGDHAPEAIVKLAAEVRQ